MASLRVLTALCLLALPLPAADPDPDLLRTLLDPASTTETPFRSVVEAVTGHRVLPADPGDPVHRVLLDAVAAALDHSLELLNAPDSPIRGEGRINEASRHFETVLRTTLDAHPDLECAVPTLADGSAQSAGYPDLRLRHVPSGTIAYLDPKLVDAGTLDSSLRTFYFTPRTTTNKIRDDALHLLAGITHDGAVGNWRFLGWKLVDLHGFRVRLKAEYQAANRDLYREDLILRASP
jgi:hypothetical protein